MKKTWLEKILTRHKDHIAYAVKFLKDNPQASNEDIRDALYAHFGRALVVQSFEIKCVADEAERIVRTDDLSKFCQSRFEI